MKYMHEVRTLYKTDVGEVSKQNKVIYARESLDFAEIVR